ncbi:choice-of-anchor M domain-containing protein [Corynebacterium glucuronolyticum]|uniref:choice-of-anchor M domain-containing protein n=1 Tax=Corynebacterium glucuronolyticum TaxID=39791 RepID=UPI00019C16C8|nr:choice-of-anchor M domain-containing protein [Corynebacterium glucuronolyticum]EEI26080.1 actinobacterial surface-anchored domain protein [Corynebacterium glucuronolyticum ATCC 51867]QRO82407.1 choice-of-anchor M domain-containing protein [Corynebacterium glucuronolyticum]
MLTRLRLPRALVAIALLLAMFAAAPVARALTLTEGHIDAFYVTSDLTLALKDDAGLHAPEDVTLAIPASAYREETAAILGEGAYFLPQAQDPDLIWPGWDTTESGTPLSIQFLDVQGPGSVYLFSQGTFGGTAPLLDGDSLELTSGSAIPQDHPGHVHANWAFTAPGTYTMTVKAVAPDGRETNTATYRWVVGDVEEAEEETATATTTSAAPAAPVPTSTSAPAEQRTLADTGISVMGLAIAFLGLGLVVFGAGIVAARRA